MNEQAIEELHALLHLLVANQLLLLTDAETPTRWTLTRDALMQQLAAFDAALDGS